jgi:hypothetical protein
MSVTRRNFLKMLGFGALAPLIPKVKETEEEIVHVPSIWTEHTPDNECYTVTGSGDGGTVYILGEFTWMTGELAYWNGASWSKAFEPPELSQEGINELVEWGYRQVD